MKPLLIILMSCSGFFCFAQQQRVFFYKNNVGLITSKDSADFIRTIKDPEPGGKLYTVTDYYINGKIKLVTGSLSADGNRLNGQYITYFPNGQRQSIANFSNGTPVSDVYDYYPNGKIYLHKKYPDQKPARIPVGTRYEIVEAFDSLGMVKIKDGNGYLTVYNAGYKEANEEGPVKGGKYDGEWKGYYSDTKISFKETYKNGELVKGSSVDSAGKVYTYNTNRSVPAEFNGGPGGLMRYISNNLRYPAAEREQGIQGSVLVTFIVEKDGKITKVKIARSLSETIDKEAVRVIENSPLWIPGTEMGRLVRQQYNVPISFALKTTFSRLGRQ